MMLILGSVKLRLDLPRRVRIGLTAMQWVMEQHIFVALNHSLGFLEENMNIKYNIFHNSKLKYTKNTLTYKKLI